MNWNFSAHGKLWVYNLNYFEFLRQPGLTVAHAQKIIDHWIASETTIEDGWEPYPTSLRTVNWILFYHAKESTMPRHVLESINRQYHNLSGKIEYHLLGNHLLENACALCCIAIFLGDMPSLARWEKLLFTELKEQYLADGAHYELSIMYHLILLWRQLDLYHLALSAPKTTLAPALAPSLRKQLGWAQSMINRRGDFPHFNDSTNGIAPEMEAINDRASALGISPVIENVGASGYRHWEDGRIEVWIDTAQIGPAYIPGHAHADSLGFILYVNGEPAIVDSGISTYEKNERRAWERSTAAHNTVEGRGKNSSDVWGGFRVGKKARTTIEHEDGFFICAHHNGYDVAHRRTLRCENEVLTIIDEFDEGTARFHFAASERPSLIGGVLRSKLFSMTWDNGNARLIPYDRATGFNRLEPAWCLVVDFKKKLTTQIQAF